jgi:hypothetical protein
MLVDIFIEREILNTSNQIKVDMLPSNFNIPGMDSFNSMAIRAHDEAMAVNWIYCNITSDLIPVSTIITKLTN